MSRTPISNTNSPRGLAFGIGAYVLWGFLPIYMKQLENMPATEVIAHRIIWSLPLAAAVLIWQHRASDVRDALRNPRLLGMAAITAALISANWLIYVWAVTHDHAVEAALGYYINPLFSILLAALLLGERLNRLQMFAVALAAVAVLILTFATGSVPLISLGLTLSWGFYAYFKRSLPLGPNQGFTLEVILLLPFALAYIAWLTVRGEGHFLSSPREALLLLGCGPITAIPLMLYANGAKLVRLSTMGILQYIPPTMILLTAVLIFGEPFGGAQLIAFPLIWAALVVYSISLLREARGRQRDRQKLAQQRAQ